ncbi:unnamed protein product [Lymnaea stagnalis]|uniref:Cadherin domain-containing protein n=1 Tax=Lymnaea stagnalis TaxID=6523 RepID=A0AAV2I5I1_LYMST
MACKFRCVLLVLMATALLPTLRANLETASVNFTFREEQDAGTYVGNVAVASGLTTKITQVVFSSLHFTILDNDYFQMSPRNGSMTSKNRIDREAVCQGLFVCKVSTSVSVYNGSFELYMFITVNVEIEDINDNAPRFSSEFFGLYVPENNAVDDEHRVSAAVDLDIGINSVAQYSFQDPSGTFRLSEHKSPDGSSYLGIVIKSVLDRETRDFYQVTIVATDGGFPKRTGSVVVNITVTDVNDNAPEFLQPSYNESVRENMERNVPIIKVQARDRDTGSNAEITYQFSSRVSDKIKETFYIDQRTGEISAKGLIDYEQDKQFQMTVEAVDHGTTQFSVRTSVTLYVMDENDNAPEINVNLPPTGTDVFESESAGYFISYISVTDVDSGDNGIVVCEMSDRHFSLDRFAELANNKYKVVLAESVDYEQHHSLKVTITCTDRGQPPLSSSAAFTVNVKDVNDNRPQFTQTTYTGTVMENQQQEQTVLTVTAYDADSGDYGKVSYSIDDKNGGFFWIDPVTGDLRVRRALDRETLAVHTFHVIAQDNGPERLSSSALVNVLVGDEDDEPPRFPQAVYFGYVLENQPSGAVAGNVTAVDPDSPENSMFSYSLSVEGDYASFSINPTNGVIKSSVVFDRETKDQYHLVVRVTDPKKPEFSSTCNFTVIVLDDNDHSPVIQMSSEENTTIVVQYSAPVGSVITTILATDEDGAKSPHSQISYFIDRGDPDQLFVLNRLTGDLTLARMVRAKDVKLYVLVIRVQDGGDPPRTDVRQLLVKINGTMPSSAYEAGLSTNILIVIILVGVTVVLALAIGIAICLIRKIDRERRLNRGTQKNSEDKMYQLKQPDIFTNTSVDGVGGSNNLSQNRKKEVSFSLDEETDSHNTSTGSAHPLTSFKGGTDRTQMHSPNRMATSGSKSLANGGMNIPVSHGSHGNPDKQSNLRRSPQDESIHLIEMLKKNGDDDLSESSGNSDPSDSGRGGSEDDSSHRGSGIDPEHNIIYPTSLLRDKPRAYGQGHLQQNGLHPPKTSRQTSLPANTGKQIRQSPSHHPSPHRSLSSGMDSGISDGSDSSKNRPVLDNSAGANYHRPHYRNTGRPVSQMLAGRPRDQYPSRSLTQDSPNRLAAPYKSSGSLMRSFHGNPNNNFQVIPPMMSVSMERLGHTSSDRSLYAPSSAAAGRANHYSDRTYPMSERWNHPPGLKEEDDRTTSSGSYTINPEELRQEIDNLILRDSVV